jgi:hypothetical protein
MVASVMRRVFSQARRRQRPAGRLTLENGRVMRRGTAANVALAAMVFNEPATMRCHGSQIRGEPDVGTMTSGHEGENRRHPMSEGGLMWMSASGRQQRGAPPPAMPSAFDHHCRRPGPAREVARASERFHHLRSVGHSRRQTDIRSTRFRERGSPRRGRRDSHLQRGKGLGIVMMLGPFF